MSKAKRILVIGGKKKNLEKAKSLGLEVLYIQKKSLFLESHLEMADKVFLFDFEDSEVLLPLSKAIHAVFPFDYVISMTEVGLVPAARIRDALGLVGNSLTTVQLLKDKGLMRERLNSVGVSPVAAMRGVLQQDIMAFAEKYGYPMIIKPIDGAGSFGIFMIHDEAEVQRVWEEIQTLGVGEFLIEEYLEGPEISVESFSFDGRHRVIAMTDKSIQSNFVEVGHSVPAQMSEEQYTLVEQMVVAFLTAVDFQIGPSHTEAKLTPRGPRIVESHNRVGGDKISELVEIAYGIDMVKMALGWPFGLVEEIAGHLTEIAGASIRFLTPEPGIVQQIEGIAEVKTHSAVHDLVVDVQVGSEVRPVKHSLDRAGYLLVKGKNVHEAIKKKRGIVGAAADCHDSDGGKYMCVMYC